MSTAQPPQSSSPRTNSVLPFLAGAVGFFLGLALLKFPNPPIFENFVVAPANLTELLVGFPWPIGWAYAAIIALAAIALFCKPQRPAVPAWLLLLPVAWFLWALLSATKSIDPSLSAQTLKHFAANLACFYLGAFVLGRTRLPSVFWVPLLTGFAIVLAIGWSQHFGGLKATREYFFENLYPRMTEVNADLLKKMLSDRIFGTMFYPNALAGLVLLLMPPLLAFLWGLNRWFTAGARGLLVFCLAAASLGCLYWSGSKGGWLLMLALLLVAVLLWPLKRQLKLGLVAVLLLAGLLGFFLKYAGFFQRGATSVSARFDYWQAAVQTSREKPLFGSGPGTFGISYAATKRPESEPSRMAHNDYLQQASDSGIPCLLLYGTFIGGCLITSFRRHSGKWKGRPETWDWASLGLWLGVLGWSLQGVSEFGLYLPALAWPAFTSFGVLLSGARISPEQVSPVPPPGSAVGAGLQHERRPHGARP